MKKLISLLCCVFTSLLCFPAFGDELSDMCAKRDAIFNKITRGNATDQEEQEFESLTSQMDALANKKIEDNTKRSEELNNRLETAIRHKEQALRFLFGNTPGSGENLGTPRQGGLTPLQVSIPSRTLNPDGTPNVLDKNHLVGGVSSLNIQLGNLLDLGIKDDPRINEAGQAVAKYSTTLQKFIADGKDWANYMIPWKGFGPSSEAADIILDEKVKLHSLGSAQYQQQRLIDEVHVSLVTNILQLAMTGDDAGLKAQIGEAATKDLVDGLQQYNGQSVDQGTWDIKTRQDKQRLLLTAAIEKDSVIQDLMNKLHKYNRHGKASMTISHILPMILGTVSLVPNMAGPAAKGALYTYYYMTGGTEDVKLLKEIYLDRRLESRVNVLSEESHLLLESVSIAKNTNNPVLYNVSTSLISGMTSPEKATEVLK